MSEIGGNGRQRGISNDVLAERLENYFNRGNESTESLHRHMDAVDSRVETALAELRNHVALPYHAQTQQDIVRLSNTLLQFERKFSEQDTKFSEISKEKSYGQGLTDGMNRSNNSTQQLITFIVGAIGPLSILIYTTFFA